MRLLLDTHAFLWFIMGDSRLSSAARAAIENPADEKLLSVGSLWEMAIKVSLGKLTLAEPFPQIIPRELKRNGFQLLPMSLAHASHVSSMPFHHRDPFDRLLVAQAMEESLVVLSADTHFDLYGIKRFW